LFKTKNRIRFTSTFRPFYIAVGVLEHCLSGR